MDIQILQLLEGARVAQGLTVVIDVFRAFSVACYAFGQGATRIFPTGSVEEAHALKAQNPDWLLVGERRGERPAQFDFGNSPSEIENVDFSGRTLIQTTSAGTRGLVNARGASEIITGSFVNASAILDFIQAQQPPKVSLVCMGNAGKEEAEEDTLCAHFLRDSLLGARPDFAVLREQLANSLASQRFLNPEKATAPRRDWDLCLDLNRFGFVLRAVRGEHNRLRLQPSPHRFRAQ